MTRTRARGPHGTCHDGDVERERCSAHRRDGGQCGAPAVKGATVCRRHGGTAPQVQRNAAQLVALREFYASLPYLERWVGQLKAEHERVHYADLWAPRKCRATRRDGQRCGCWAIRGGYVCRVHGGAAPQVRRKAAERLAMVKVYREMGAALGLPRLG